MRSTLLLLAIPFVARAGDPWKVGGRVGMRQDGSKVVPTAAITAEYLLHDKLSWRTDFEAQFRDLSKMDEVAMQVPTHLLWHPAGSRAKFDPYVGPGASFGLDFDQNAMLGLNGTAGFTIRPNANQAFGMEWRWSWPDLTRNTKGRWDAALTGNWELKF